MAYQRITKRRTWSRPQISRVPGLLDCQASLCIAFDFNWTWPPFPVRLCYSYQFSSFNLDILENSFILWVTKTPWLAKAVPAINTSWAPIGAPFFSKLARIAADKRASSSPKGRVSTNEHNPFSWACLFPGEVDFTIPYSSSYSRIAEDKSLPWSCNWIPFCFHASVLADLSEKGIISATGLPWRTIIDHYGLKVHSLED